MRPLNKYLLFLTTGIGAFLAPFTSSAISFAEPQIGYAFKANFYYIIWVPQGFIIALATTILIIGRLSDSLGRVKFYRLGYIIFLVGIALSIFSLNIIMLIISLFIAGTGSAILASNSTAIVSQVFEGRGRGKALGINVMAVYLGLTLSPPLSGVLIMLGGWKSILYFTVPISVVGFIISLITLRALEIKHERNKLDMLGGLIFTLFIFSIVIFLTIGEMFGWSSSLILIPVIILLFFFFVFRESHVINPLMDLSLFTKNRTFLASNLTALFNYASTFSIVFVFSIYLQVIDGLSPGYAGILLISEPVFMVIFSPISGILSDRYGSREVAAIGMGMIGLSFLFLSFVKIAGVIYIIIPLSVIGIGFGLFSAANTNSVMNSVNNKQYGVASGTLGTMRFTGQLTSIAIAGTILTTSISRRIILGIFSGASNISHLELGNAFYNGFKIIMLVSGILSLVGVYTSLLKNKNK